MAKISKNIDDSRIPDGGWGWMIVVGVAITNMFNQALVSVFGLLFGQHLEEMGYKTSGIALVSNINNMVLCFSGLITGPVLERYSCRSVAMAGSLFTFFGLLMSSFSSNIVELIIFYSCLTGLGLGLIYPATFVAIKSYFLERRARAVGLSLAGTGLGQMLMPQLVRVLLDEYGFRWTIRIVAVLCLHGAVGSLLYQPVSWHLKPIKNEVNETLLNKNNNIIKIEPLTEQKNIDNTKDENESPKQRWYQQFHLSLFKDIKFLNLSIGLALVYTSSIAFGTLFPLLLQQGSVIQLSRADAALAMTFLSASDIVSRVTVPWIMWKIGISSRVTYMWGTLLLAGARTLIALQDSRLGILITSLICGYIRATTVINQNLSISEYCSKKKIDNRLPAAIGLTQVSKGIAVISLGQLLGWIRDYTKSYVQFVYATNILMITVFISWGIEYLVSKIKQKKNDKLIDSNC